jgi:hypothetical protein
MTNNSRKPEADYSPEKIAECIRTLETLAENSEWLATLTEDQWIALMVAAGKLSRPDRDEIRKRNKDKNRLSRKALVAQERQARSETGIRSARNVSVFTAPKQITDGSGALNAGELKSPRN